MTTDTRLDVAELELHELEAALARSRASRASTAARSSSGFIARGVTDFAQMTDLGRELRDAADAARSTSARRRRARERSTDGTTKFLLELADGNHIESVYSSPDTPVADVLPLDAGRVRDAMRVLPDRQDGHRSAI